MLWLQTSCPRLSNSGYNSFFAAQKEKEHPVRMRGWGNGISSSSHCCEVFSVHRQDISQTATVLKSFMSVFQTGNCSVSVVPQTLSEMLDLGGVCICNSSFFFLGSVFWTQVCLPVCQWDVWCTSSFVMVDCSAFQTRNEDQAWFHWAPTSEGALVFLSNPALAWLTHGEFNPLNLAMPCSTYLATCHRFISSTDKDKNTSASQTSRRHGTKDVQTQILTHITRPEPVCVTVFSL